MPCEIGGNRSFDNLRWNIRRRQRTVGDFNDGYIGTLKAYSIAATRAIT
jgi:hypothetical protein